MIGFFFELAIVYKIIPQNLISWVQKIDLPYANL